MLRAARILARSLLLICPACWHGRIFRSLFKLNVRCPVCGVIFERDAGEITGAIAINTTLTMFIGLVGAGTAQAYFPDLPLLLLLGALSVLMIVFPLWFYRHAHGLWIGIIYLTGSMFED